MQKSLAKLRLEVLLVKKNPPTLRIYHAIFEVWTVPISWMNRKFSSGYGILLIDEHQLAIPLLLKAPPFPWNSPRYSFKCSFVWSSPMDVLRQYDLNTWVSGMWWNIPSHPISILWILAKNYHLLGWMWDDPHLIDIIGHLFALGEFASQMILSNFRILDIHPFLKYLNE